MDARSWRSGGRDHRQEEEQCPGQRISARNICPHPHGALCIRSNTFKDFGAVSSIAEKCQIGQRKRSIPCFKRFVMVHIRFCTPAKSSAAIALSIITVPSETVYDSIFQTLKRTYSDSESLAVKAVAIHTLSAAAVFGGASDSELEEIMDDLLEIVESDGSSIEAADSGEVVTAACEAWGFLATSIDDMEEKTEVAMDAFVEQLESSDVSVQVAAGENIALLFEKSYTARETDDGPASDEEDEEGLPIDNTFVKRYEVYRQKDQLKHTLSQLASESSRRIAKKDRKVLHTNFSDILNTVEYPFRGPRYQNAINEETGRRYGSRMVVRIHKTGTMKIDAWWKLHRLQALRRVLGGGFVVHYENNEVVFDSLPIMISAS
ncbi:hypothetical protein ONS95_003900 [Cadophora gregata]|uniref:uncharacterized protein n=1 Tax=Cadophora gregata TaxID=51156 RepID=UPI0026DD7BEB|nr:uncharacterized protein ONS95_003900 [Cadophora gregata]KAK0107196.1 hypothetical protein ONS95_003900 [Cadophora gregata]KAK0116880.1 hypothetical protein ONS96_012726 [Cadophora gregata f. sp. sojae]